MRKVWRRWIYYDLPHTDTNSAKEITERIRISIKNYYSENLKLTISIGLSNCPTTATTKKNLIRYADDALYISKKNGKNKLTIKQAISNSSWIEKIYKRK